MLKTFMLLNVFVETLINRKFNNNNIYLKYNYFVILEISLLSILINLIYACKIYACKVLIVFQKKS